MATLCERYCSMNLYIGRRVLKSAYRLAKRCASSVQAESRPLDGIRVIDMTRVLAGPYCSMLLGDLGAEVIKIERPGEGDETRQWGPPWLKSSSAYFMAVNRNKMSACINFRAKEGADIIRKMASTGDILLENMLPGKLSEYGLGYEQLRAINPRLIYVSITGFGQTGPYSTRGGYDNIASAIGGLIHITGPEDGEPCRVGVAMVDLSTGLYAHGAIMAALLHRHNTGSGQHVDCNLLNTQIATLSHIASNYLNCGQEARRYGTGHPSLVPYQAFKTRDNRYIMVGAGTNSLFVSLVQSMGLPALGKDARFINNNGRVQNRKELLAVLSARFLEKDLSEWLDTFEGVVFPYGPINNVASAFADPQVIHNEMIQVIDHPVEGQIRIPGPAVKYSNCSLTARLPPPQLGEHTTHVLSKLLNYDEASIEQLRKRGIIA